MSGCEDKDKYNSLSIPLLCPCQVLPFLLVLTATTKVTSLRMPCYALRVFFSNTGLMPGTWKCVQLLSECCTVKISLGNDPTNSNVSTTALMQPNRTPSRHHLRNIHNNWLHVSQYIASHQTHAHTIWPMTKADNAITAQMDFLIIETTFNSRSFQCLWNYRRRSYQPLSLLQWLKFLLSFSLVQSSYMITIGYITIFPMNNSFPAFL